MMVSITDRSERIVVFAILGLAAALRIAAAIVLPDQATRWSMPSPTGIRQRNS